MVEKLRTFRLMPRDRFEISAGSQDGETRASLDAKSSGHARRHGDPPNPVCWNKCASSCLGHDGSCVNSLESTSKLAHGLRVGGAYISVHSCFS
jgi:hypothetical protein